MRIARGRPASRRIPLPPECLPRATRFGGDGGREMPNWIRYRKAISIVHAELGVSVLRAQAMLRDACIGGFVRSRAGSVAKAYEASSIIPGNITYVSSVPNRRRTSRLVAPQEWTWSIIDVEDGMLRPKIGFGQDIGPVEINRNDLTDWIKQKKQRSGKPVRRSRLAQASSDKPSAKRRCVIDALERRGYYPDRKDKTDGELVNLAFKDCEQHYQQTTKGRAALKKMIQRIY